MTGIENLSMESIKLLLVLTIIVLGVAITLIGYFMSKRDSAITEATQNLTKAVEQLQIIVNGLQMQYQIRQPLIDEQLKQHLKYIETNSERIDETDKRVAKLETEHEVFRCNYQEPKKIRTK
jgi:type II secretory pathway pseudopilin PulG